jgi:hypothetical protein
LSVFLDRLSREKFPRLRGFQFDGNPMNSSQTLKFIEFIDNHPKLSALSLDRSIDVTDSAAGLISFVSVMSKRQFLGLSLAGDGSLKFAYGQLLLPLLRSDFLASIQYLDISYQAIGEKGLRLISRVLNQFIELYFDGSLVASFNFLCRFCERILASNLKFASFPTTDFARYDRLVSRQQNMMEQRVGRDLLANDFAAKYKKPEKMARLRDILSTIETPTFEAGTKKSPSIGRSLSRSDSDVGIGRIFEGMAGPPERIADLYRECVTEGDEVPPLMRLLASIEESATFSQLLSEIC